MARVLIIIVILALAATVTFAQEPQHAQNIAFGKIVTYAPLPNYGLTAKGGTDATDLTNGELSKRDDAKLWFDSTCVGWSYGGRVNLSIDLEEIHAISEVTIRLMAGAGRNPLWVELLVSDDGTTYYKVDEYSVFNAGDRDRFGIPRYGQEAEILPLRFTNLNTRGRYVGVRMYTTGLSCAEEIYVTAGTHDANAVKFAEEHLTDFSVTTPEMHFHKPLQYVSMNINTPVPIGLTLPEGYPTQAGTCIMELPAGLRMIGGSLGGTPITDLSPIELAAGLRYEIPVELKTTTKTFGRVYIAGNWPEGRQGTIRYKLIWQDGESPMVTQPVQAITIPTAPRPKRLMTTLGWWTLSATKEWPESLEAFATIGFNTASTFAVWMPEDDAELWAFRDEVKKQGFKMLNIDSPIHRMMTVHRDNTEWQCQLEDDKTSSRFCPSYRGDMWDEEMDRIASQNARLKPDYWFPDIEVWNWRGPVDAENCTRCKADFKASGAESWKEWKLGKGFEMWAEMATRVRDAVREAGGPEIEFGVYDWRPGSNYQFTWPMGDMYPDLIQNAQCSTYTPLYPENIVLIGDETREDALRLGSNDCMPWTTPGDAGVFSGEAMYRSLLEQFFNGARGTNFWSGRVWDGDMLQGYARAVKVVTPVEDIVVDGVIAADRVRSDTESLRISAIARGKDLIFLLGNYWEEDLGRVRVRLPLSDGRYEIIDLEAGNIVAQLDAAPYVFSIAWGNRGTGAYWARPME